MCVLRTYISKILIRIDKVSDKKNINKKWEKPISLYPTTPKSYHPMPMAK